MNLGKADRTLRVIAAFTLAISAVAAPIPLIASFALGATGLYMLGSSLVGTCLGYKLMGVSTCPVSRA